MSVRGYSNYADGYLFSRTDLQKIIIYLDDAAKLYDALAALPMQKCNSRSHMIRQLTDKIKSKIKKNRQDDKSRTH